MNSCVEKYGFKNCGSKLFGSRRIFLYKYLWNNYHTKVPTRVRMKPPNDIIFLLVECNSFLKTPRQMKGCLIMVYIQEHHSESEYIIKYSKFQWGLFVIYELISSCIIGFYDYKSLLLYNGCLETVHSNN